MRRRALVAGVIALALVAGTVVAARVLGSRTHRFDIDGAGPLVVTAPAEAGTPTATPGPAVVPDSLMLGVRALTRSVRVESRPFDGDATVTFSYDPATLPAGVTPTEDLTVLMFAPELGTWLPAETSVDQVARTATAHTRHFSDWALGVTDPVELRDQQLLADRLARTAGGRIAQIIVGEQNAPDCDPRNALLPAVIREPTSLSPKLCQEVLPDGSYRIDYVNTSGMPRLLTLPPGFVRRDAFVRSTNQVFADALGTRHPGTAVVLDGDAIEMTFRDADVAPDTRITGDTDWGIYLMSLVRLVGATLLADKKDGDEFLDKLDGVLLAGDLWDCFDTGTDTMRTSGNLLAAAKESLCTCAKEAAEAIVSVIEAAVGGFKLSVKSIFKKVTMLLDVPKLMELARTEMNGLLTVMARAGGVDTSLTIIPARTMRLADAQALPTTPLWDETSGGAGCGTLPPGPAVPNLPGGVCVSTIEADLDGNGRPDRLLLWHPPHAQLAADQRRVAAVGAVAYTDDGGVHPLADPPSAWLQSELQLSIEYFDPTAVVRLGTDARQQVVVAITLGANTTHHAELALARDGRLRAVTSASGGPFTLASGGGAGYSSAFGCVTSHGTPLVAVAGSVTMWGPPTRYGWSREYYRLDDVTLRLVGHEGGVAGDNRGPGAGADCTAPDPATRGPDVGEPGLPGDSVASTAQGFLTAVLDDDRSGVSRYLSGTGTDSSWAEGRGVDAWLQARIATQSARTAWRDAQLRCGPEEPGFAGSVDRSCVYRIPSTTVGLFLRLHGDAGGWTVTGALGS